MLSKRVCFFIRLFWGVGGNGNAKAAIVLLTAAALLQVSAAAAIGSVWVLSSWGSYSETAIGFPTAAALLHRSAAAASCSSPVCTPGAPTQRLLSEFRRPPRCCTSVLLLPPYSFSFYCV